jgi:hypothetical protein
MKALRREERVIILLSSEYKYEVTEVEFLEGGEVES